MEPVIKIKNLGKRYNINHRRAGGYVALRDVIGNIIKRPFKFAKTKAKQVLGRETKEEFWALKDINLEVNKGDVIGVIGKNGAGKSTLLKILTQITPPTEGEVVIKGKVASLLEVGTGFHPELTGRENILLNGAIMGMTRKEIERKFDQIVEFSGVSQFLDTPVKRYSSGMYVRLAFSVAAHLEPDILLIDEVLAVGDAEFQRKCLGKMDEVTRQAGRTIIFVSHNMAAVQKLCRKVVLLNKGKIEMIGETAKVIEHYLNSDSSAETVMEFEEDKNKEAQFLSVKIENKDGKPMSSLPNDEEWKINIKYKANEQLPKTMIAAEFYSSSGVMFYMSAQADGKTAIADIEKGTYETTLTIPALFLNPNSYFIGLSIQSPRRKIYDGIENLPLTLYPSGKYAKDDYSRGSYLGYVGTINKWDTKKIN